MFRSLSLRMMARLWVMVVLLAATFLAVFSFEASAVPGIKPKTQTSGGSPNAPQGRPSQSISPPTVHSSEPSLIDMGAEVADHVAREGGQYVSGRETEVLELDNKFAISDSGAVAVVAEPKSGRTAVFEEFIRTHPGNKFFRLNLKKLALMTDQEATVELKKIMAQQLPAEVSNLSGKGRVYLFVENLNALKQGTFMQPIQVLWEQLITGVDYFVALETDAQTLDGEINPEKSKYKNLKGLVEVLRVKPPLYDSVLEAVLRDRAKIERGGVGFSYEAAEEAARIASLHYKQNALKYAKAMLSASVDMVQSDQQKGSSLADRLSGEINQLNLKLKALLSDFNVETDVKIKDGLGRKITTLNDQVLAKQTDLAALTQTTGTTQKLAGLEIQRNEIRERLEKAKANVGFFSRSTPEVNNLNSALEQVANQITELENERLQSEVSGKPATRVGGRQVVAIASRWLKMPPSRLSSNFDEGVHNVSSIKNVVFSQDHVIDAIESKLVISKTHLYEGRDLSLEDVQKVKKGLLTDSYRPVGSFWFAGNTGVGKTEIAKQLSDVLGLELLRFDMSEFMERHYASRLIGAPPGYVGFDQPGELLEAVRRNPYQVILFDEIEKAHPDVFNVLLQVLDDGRLTDSKGNTVDFRNTIIIFTSNLAQKISTWQQGECINFLKSKGWTDENIKNRTQFNKDSLRREAYKVYVTDPEIAASENRVAMRPELVNRIDDLMVFNNLSEADAVRIAQKSMRQFLKRMEYFYDITVRFSPEAVTQLVGYFNENEGGRSMRRAFDNIFRTPIARLVFDQKLSPGDTLLVSADPNKGLEFIQTNQATVDAALTHTTGEVAPLNDLKTAIKQRRKGNAKLLAARAATGELVDKIFDAKYLISERAFRWIKAK